MLGAVQYIQACFVPVQAKPQSIRLAMALVKQDESIRINCVRRPIKALLSREHRQ